MHSPIATYLTETLESVASDTSGELANYIPELAAVDPDKLAASIAMVDGEQYAAGDSDVEFTIQSISKPFVYAWRSRTAAMMMCLRRWAWSLPVSRSMSCPWRTVPVSR